MNQSIAIVFVVFIAWSSAALGQPASAQAEVLFRQRRDLLATAKSRRATRSKTARSWSRR